MTKSELLVSSAEKNADRRRKKKKNRKGRKKKGKGRRKRNRRRKEKKPGKDQASIEEMVSKQRLVDLPVETKAETKVYGNDEIKVTDLPLVWCGFF